MSKEIDDYINEQVAAGRGTKQQILEQFAKSDDAELTAYAANANKPKVEETKKTMMDLATTPHPILGISPADVALYGGGAALSWQAGKKLADLGIQGMSNLGGQISNTIFGKAGSSAPPPSTSTQDLMATPDVEKTPIADKLAAESEARFKVPLSDVEKHFDVKITNLKDAEILSNSYKNSLSGAVSNQPAGVPTIQPNVPANPAGAFSQPSGYSQAAPQQTLTQAVEAGGDVGQALKTDVAKMVDQAATPAAPVSPSSAIKVEGLVRDAQGNFQYPEGMSPAAIQAHKSFVQQYPEISANLEAQGKFGMVGGGAADNSLHNSYGANLRKQILNEVNQGQMGGINTNYLEKINPAIKALSSEEGLGKTLAELKANNPKGGIHGPLGIPATIGKAGELVTKPGAVSGAVNKGSKALLLMAMADAAKAAEKGNTAPAKEVGFDLATGYGLSKLLGGPAAAALALALGSSGLNAGEEQELARRRASRGIAPPNQR